MLFLWCPIHRKKSYLLKQRHRKLSDLSEEGRDGARITPSQPGWVFAHSPLCCQLQRGPRSPLWVGGAFEFPLGRNELDVMFRVSPFQHLMGIWRIPGALLACPQKWSFSGCDQCPGCGRQLTPRGRGVNWFGQNCLVQQKPHAVDSVFLWIFRDVPSIYKHTLLYQDFCTWFFFLLLFSRLFRESAYFAIFLSTTSLIHFFCPSL